MIILFKRFLYILILFNNDLFSIEIINDRYPLKTENVLNLVSKYLPDNPIILEAGARFGEDTEIISKYWPNGIIHAFEPFPSSFDKLKSVASKYKNIYCHPLALTNKSGKQSFYVSFFYASPANPRDPGASSLLKPIMNKEWFYSDTIEVDCITPNEWIKNNNITKIDFMWLDMEGSELLFLSELKKDILQTTKVIFTEINFLDFRENSCTYWQLNRFLNNNGFVEIHRRQIKGYQGESIYIQDENLINKIKDKKINLKNEILKSVFINELKNRNINLDFFLENLNQYIDENNRITMLMHAANSNNYELVKLLLDCGANPIIKSSFNDWIALDFAKNHNYIQIIELLLYHTLKFNITNYVQLINTIEFHGLTLENILNNVNQYIDKKNGITLLMYAVNFGYNDVVKLLLNYGADYNIKTLPTSINVPANWTALDFAISHKFDQIIKLLPKK